MVAVIGGSAAGLWLWTNRSDSGQTLAETQEWLAYSDEQIAAPQIQLADEHRDRSARFQAQREDFEARANARATAGLQLTRAVDQFKALQALPAAERQGHKAEIQSQQMSHAATVDQLHLRISELAAHVVELSKAVTEVQLVP